MIKVFVMKSVMELLIDIYITELQEWKRDKFNILSQKWILELQQNVCCVKGD